MRRPDLNTLVILSAVYREGSVTRAAERLNLTQSAISHGLGRLRVLFDDPLFVRRGNRLVSTPLARSLAEEAYHGLNQLEALFERKASFDPAEHARSFTLGIRDVLEAPLLPPLIAAMTAAAPLASLTALHLRRNAMATRLASSSVDAVVDVCLETPPEVLSERIAQEDFCVVARSGHPLADQSLDLAAYLDCDHVVISARPEGDVFEDARLRALGHRRRIKLRCQHYLAGYRAAQISDLIVTMPRRLAEMFRSADDTDPLPVPFEIGRMDFHLYWHASRAEDPANLWFREMIKRAARRSRQPA